MLKAARIDREEAIAGEENAPSASVTLAPTAVAPAVPVMTGTHFHALDEKGRVIIPSKLRPALTGQFWLVLDDNDNIAIYNYRTGLDVFEYCEQMLAEYADDEDVADAVKRTMSTAELVTAEGNWRVQVPELLRIHAQLDKEIVTEGFINSAVIMDRDRWESEQERRLQNKRVRQVQGKILRAAASGAGRKAQGYEQAKAEEEALEARAASGTPDSYAARGGDGAAAGVQSRGRAFEKTASAGDGRRSSRILALSKIGR